MALNPPRRGTKPWVVLMTAAVAVLVVLFYRSLLSGSGSGGGGDLGSGSLVEDNRVTVLRTTPITTTTTTAPVFTADSARQCLEHVPASAPTRLVPDWAKCSSTAIPVPLLEDLRTYELSDDGDVASAPVHLLQGTDDRQLCNKISVIGGMLYNMTQAHGRLGLQKRILALNSNYSPAAWALNIEALSRSLFGVLFDCQSCDVAHDSPPTFLRCGSLVRRGRVYAVPDRIWAVHASALDLDLYARHRPKNVGYMSQLNTMLQPNKALEFLVGQALAKAQLTTTQASSSVGIHLRNMDGTCYERLSRVQQEYNCHPRFDLSREFTEMGLHRVRSPQQQGTSRVEWTGVVDFTSGRVDSIEQRYPLAMVCNYSLSAVQVGLLRARWPVLFLQSAPLQVVLASDGSSPEAEQSMQQSEIAGTVTRLGELDSCLAGFKYHDMLADMVAMSLTDFHMGNPLSSCDDLVVHWRMARGKKRGTSYPPGCYDAYWG